MKDWRELFEDDALVDGWELYLDGKVENLEVYEEEIEGDDIIEITCECHESLEGGFCKHMAAMYYEFEDEHGTVWEENKDKEAE